MPGGSQASNRSTIASNFASRPCSQVEPNERVVASSRRPTVGMEQHKRVEDTANALRAMGFSQPRIDDALRNANGGGLDRALTWLRGLSSYEAGCVSAAGTYKQPPTKAPRRSDDEDSIAAHAGSSAEIISLVTPPASPSSECTPT